MNNILFADDHVLLRDALTNLINSFQDFRVLDTADNGKELIQLMNNGIRPNIILLDLNMPVMDGFETAKWLHEHRPNIHTLMLTMYDSEIALIRLLQYGVRGFLKKDIALIGRSLQDVIVEPVRCKLIPGFDDVKQKSLQVGALGGGISGSGPSLFMLSADNNIAIQIEKEM